MRDVPGLALGPLVVLIGAGEDGLDSTCLPESACGAGLMFLEGVSSSSSGIFASFVADRCLTGIGVVLVRTL